MIAPNEPRWSAVWIGECRLGGQRHVVLAEGTSDDTELYTMSFLGLELFRAAVDLLETRGDDREYAVDVAGTRHTVVLGEDGGARLLGRIAAPGSDAGTLELRRVLRWDAATYRAVCGTYRHEDREVDLFVELDAWVGDPVLFYAEQDRLVPVYPTGTHEVFSEDGEGMTFSPDLQTVTVQSSKGREAIRTTMRRVEAWVEEEAITVGDAGKLVGTLLKPPGGEPTPAVVMIHGAAGGQRDMYRAFAAQFARMGMAALIFDRRGWGDSEGSPNPTFSEKAADAWTWVKYLRSHPDVVGDHVGVWGFSNGSWVAPLVAARHPETAFVAVIGAAGTTPLRQEIFRREFELGESGVDGDVIEVVADAWRTIYDCLLNGVVDTESGKRFDELMASIDASHVAEQVTLHEYARQEPFLGPVPPFSNHRALAEYVEGRELDQEAWLLDPVDSYRELRVPVLYMAGLDDSNLPAAESAERVGRALADAGNTRAVAVIFPATGHSMNITSSRRVGMSDQEAGYLHHGFRFAGGYLALLGSWVEDRRRDALQAPGAS